MPADPSPAPADPGREPARDPWARLRAATRARIGLGLAGDALALREVLDLQLAHALARDAVHAALDEAALEAALAPHPAVRVRSAAPDRNAYLRRPDLGRRLHPECRDLLAPGGFDVAFVLATGCRRPRWRATRRRCSAPACPASAAGPWRRR